MGRSRRHPYIPRLLLRVGRDHEHMEVVGEKDVGDDADPVESLCPADSPVDDGVEFIRRAKEEPTV